MNHTTTKNLSLFFIILNSLAFFAGMFFLIRNLLIACAVALLLSGLNFMFYQIYMLHAGQLSEEKAENDTASSTDISENLEEQLQTLTENCALLRKENASLQNEIKKYKTPVNLNKFFSAYLKEHARIFEENHIKASIQTDNKICACSLSSTALTLICNNLLDNTLKFTPPGGTLLLTLTKNEKDTLIIWKNIRKGNPKCDTETAFHFNQIKAIVVGYGGCIWEKSTNENEFAVYLQLPYKPKGESAL